ncbi:uncharacterized protein GIQ15_05432 [Arthroderma uncinatum]|uniref:uncharacterized protein n=1 Tax=Arthroderma uncinatum TaxID=74035 RepID=UPI00144A7BBB|nr:uncharacterized protein GIQ15_05432 [Arthroderma uncinatum]KAF3480085.1 hypothetical protein GIQ15_05432 [Arthroderma uncinatum]
MPPRLGNAQRLLSSQRQITSSQSPLIYNSSTALSSSSISSPCRSLPQSRAFSSTPRVQAGPSLRQELIWWLKGPGSVFRNPLPGSTNYVSAYDDKGVLRRERHRRFEGEDAEEKNEGENEDEDISAERMEDLRPFPLNQTFHSQSVLSEELRNEIYEQVVTKGNSVRHVSVSFGIDMRRIGAVVRLVELEKRMRSEKKPLALPYARAIHQMVPLTPLAEKGELQRRHEPINDLPVHKLTDPQIFYPVSESRRFTRVDAARVFSAAPEVTEDKRDVPGNTPEAIAKITQAPHNIERVGKGANEQQVLQPADVRIPHPHLVAFEHDVIEFPSETRKRSQRYNDRLKAEMEKETLRKEKKKAREAAQLTRVQPENGRFEFRFRDVVVSRETTGLDGRGVKGVGRRYGVPHADRRRGEVKIPTKVEV